MEDPFPSYLTTFKATERTTLVNNAKTLFPAGSIQELWAISLPIMLSLLSANSMIFFNRLILAQYSTTAMNAAVLATSIFSIFQLGSIGIATITEIFVAQSNGAKHFYRLGDPVWQMVWFSLLTSIFFIPLGIWGGQYFIVNPDYQADAIPCFQWLMFFGPLFPLCGALSSFFIGRGCVKLVLINTVICNVLNILLNMIFVFGIDDWIPPLGAKGVAFAMGTAQTILAVLLGAAFLSKTNRKNFGTGHWKFKPRLFMKSFSIGFPNAISSTVEYAAWATLTQILAAASDMHLTVFSISDSVFYLFVFAFWGLQKGVTNLAANYIGAKQEYVISKILRSGMAIIFVMMLFLIIPLFIFPDVLINLFMDGETMNNPELREHLIRSLHWVWGYCFVDAFAWLFCGVLMARGDTTFVMIMNTITAWAISIIPLHFALTHFSGTPTAIWFLFVVYGFTNALAFYLRYKHKRWRLRAPLHAAT